VAPHTADYSLAGAGPIGARPTAGRPSGRNDMTGFQFRMPPSTGSTASGDGAIDIRFERVTKRYGTVVALDSVNLAVRRGAFHSLLGPSGCGKTTSLRLIAGFEQPTEGSVEIGGVPMAGIPAYRRPVNMVFQHYALFPHLDVAANIAFGLRQQRPRPDRAEIDRRVEEMLALVRLPGMAARRIWELSGGQQQRVALARALINRPTVLLLDEPLAALDRKLRRDMQIELQNLQREVGITFVLVTHDQEEALSMSDTISIMREGHIVQSGPPNELYDAPANRYVADFVGESNFFDGTVRPADARGGVIELADGRRLAGLYSRHGDLPAAGASGTVAIRPEVIQIWRANGGDPEGLDCRLDGEIRNRIYLGDHAAFSVATPLGDVLVRATKSSRAVAEGYAPGDTVVIGWRRDNALVLASG
jgi:spermidine/putrescine transport system ATP-binding protein